MEGRGHPRTPCCSRLTRKMKILLHLWNKSCEPGPTGVLPYMVIVYRGSSSPIIGLQSKRRLLKVWGMGYGVWGMVHSTGIGRGMGDGTQYWYRPGYGGWCTVLV